MKKIDSPMLISGLLCIKSRNCNKQVNDITRLLIILREALRKAKPKFGIFAFLCDLFLI